MIHAYASIWRCLKSAHKGGNGNNCQAVYREYMKGEEGVWGASAPQKPTECQRSQIKWKLLLFNDGVGGAVAWWLTPRTPDPGLLCCVLEQDIFTPKKYW